MHIRPLTRSDLPLCATAISAASIDDPLFALLAPGRHEHPNHWWSYNLECIKRLFTARGNWGIVCVTDADDVGHEVEDREEVLGVAFWHRSPATLSSYAEQAWIPTNETWAMAVERTLQSMQQSFWETVAPNANLAMDVGRVRDFRQSQIDQRPFLPLKYGYWQLKLLAVHPNHQRHGIGRALLQWGLDHATRERVPVAVIASAVGRRLYDKVGFKVIDALVVPGLSDPDPAMIWNPRKQWARDLKEGDRQVSKLGMKMEAVWTDKAKAGLTEQERARLPGYDYSESM